ncbi:MAG: hypothetical protein AAB802_02080 [Patescibacteria group bacterium]
MTFWIFYFLLNAFDVVAVLSGRYYVETKNKFYKWNSVLFFALSAFMVYKLMAFKETAVISILWISLSTILILVYCRIVFKEKISFSQAIGMAFIAGGVLLV